MNWQNICFDWNQVRAFLVTAEEGSLSAAARALGLTQPTLGRQVAALEEALGVTLFDRTGRAMVLTRSTKKDSLQLFDWGLSPRDLRELDVSVRNCDIEVRAGPGWAANSL